MGAMKVWHTLALPMHGSTIHVNHISRVVIDLQQSSASFLRGKIANAEVTCPDEVAAPHLQAPIVICGTEQPRLLDMLCHFGLAAGPPVLTDCWDCASSHARVCCHRHCVVLSWDCPVVGEHVREYDVAQFHVWELGTLIERSRRLIRSALRPIT